MASCLVMGANGFIGSHIVDALAAQGHRIRAFDRFGNKGTRFRMNDKVEVFPGDFLNRGDRKAALSGIDYVFHFISTTTPLSAENDPLIDIETNVHGSVEFFQDCVEAGIKKVVFASTGGAIYGTNSSGEPIAETVIPEPFSPYAIGKLAIEHYLRYFQKKFGLSSVVFRISNPYGERQSLAARQGVIPIFLQHIARQEPITILGDGGMVRDYIYIKDVARMITGAFEAATQPVYNLGSGHGVTVNELVDTIRGIVGRNVMVEHQDNLPTFVEKIVLDTGLFTREFGLVPETDLKNGIEQTWQYVLDQLKEEE